LLIAPKDSSPRGWVTFVALPLFVAQVTLLTVVNFSLGNLRSFDTAWRPKVAAIYAKECVGASPDKLVTIPNIPNVFGTPGRAATIFPVTVPCRSLAR